jgi:hypothetical protein
MTKRLSRHYSDRPNDVPATTGALMAARDRTQRHVAPNPMVAAAFGSIMVGAIAAFEVSRLTAAHRLVGQAIWPPVVIGLSLVIGTAALLGWVKHGWSRFSGRARSLWGKTLVTASIAMFVWFGITHPRHSGRSNTPTTAFTMTGVVYFAVIFSLVAVALPVLVWRRPRHPEVGPRDHRSDDLVEIWHVREESRKPDYAPYFVARCECGFVGEAYDDTDQQAQSAAFADARAHGTNVASEVGFPLS